MKFHKPGRRGLVAVAAASLMVLAVSGSAYGSGNSGQITTHAVKGYVKGLPASLKSLYTNSEDILGPSAYSKWKPVKTPWTLCFNNSYLGNTWRAAALTEFNKLAKQYKAAGLVTKYLSTNSNLSLPTQIQQMDALIHVDHCSGIITIPTGTSGMNSVIKQAYLAGIPVVDDLGPTSSPYAENFDENWYTSAVAQAQFLVKAIHGKGNLLDVVGIAGETIDVEYQAALKSVLSHYPNVHIIGQATGQVTDSVAQSAVLQFLSTHPQTINAVFQEGGMGAGILAAFKQEGRAYPALNFVGSGSTISLLHDAIAAGKKVQFFGQTDPPGWTMEQSFLILVRILEGQHPSNITIFYPPPTITAANINKWWTPKLSATTTIWPEPPSNPLPTNVMNGFFTNGSAPLPYKAKG
jgi:ribose transport system substrate-binding protein